MRWLVFVLLALFSVACTPEASYTPTGRTREVEMVAKQFAYEPAVVTVAKGDHVRLIITSADVTHGISLPTFGVSGKLAPGEVTTLEFDASKAGMFEFRCNVFCGSGHSDMIGAIEVTEGTE